MSDRDQQNIKRRLAGEGRPPPEIGRMTPEVALKLALARACDDTMSLEAVALNVEMRRVVLGKLLDDLPENPLISLLKGPGEQMGLAILDGQFLGGVIEKQTTGRVVPSPAVDRPPTRTDAVMSADVISAILSCFQHEGEEAGLPLTPVWSGFNYLMPLENGRAVQMAMEDIPYRLFEAHLDLEKGAKEGKLFLVFPFDPPRAVSRTSGENAEGEEGILTEVVQDTKLHMNAVLHRCEMALSDITALTVGAMVPIPRDTIAEIQIEDLFCERVSYGSLGAKAGHRAVRINLTKPAADQSPAVLIPSDLSGPASVEMPQELDVVDMPAPDMGGGPMPVPGLPDLPVSEGENELPPLAGGDGFPSLETPIGALPPLEGEGEMPDLADLGQFGSME